MEIQLSSGQGPEECELAVGKLLEVLKLEFPDLTILESLPGRKAGCYRSVRITSPTDLSFLEGTVKWICPSPYRPHHKRKNWFIDISICSKADEVEFDGKLIRFETFRSSGKGGQNVNKVETGVRAIHISTGLSVVSTEARSQQLNKKIALERLCSLFAQQNQCNADTAKALNRLEHIRLERGAPQRVYSGINFDRV